MNRDDKLQLIRRMVEIPSVSRQEGALAEFLVSEMTRLGMRSFQDEAGNAVGMLGEADGPLIMLLGHMDTVPGWIPVRTEGDLLYGRGAVDAKGPLATFICAAVTAGALPARLVVVGAVEEEIATSRGARFLLDQYSPDVVIIGEPSGYNSVVLGYKGRIGLTYATSRPQSHSAGPGENAAELAIEFWNRLSAYFAQWDTGKGLFYRPVASLTRMDAFDQHAHMEISCRIPPGFDLAALQEFLESIRGGGTLRIDEMLGAVLQDRTAEPVRALMGAIRRHGAQAGLKVKTGTSDMNTVATRWSVPMVAYGPGDSALDHTPNEHLNLEEYLSAIEILADALQTLAAELSRTPTRQTAPMPPPRVSLPVELYEAARTAAEAGPGSAEDWIEETVRERLNREGRLAKRDAYTQEEEAEISRRLHALGYLE